MDQKIYCDKCGKYLFTEIFQKDGKITRQNDNEEDYEYDGIADIFVCNECKSKEKIISDRQNGYDYENERLKNKLN